MKRVPSIITKLIIGFGLITSLMAVPLAPAPVMAACKSTDLSLTGGINCAAPGSASQKSLFDKGGLFQIITNTLILIIGAVSVLMIIIGGLRYVLSAGSPQATAGAKDTILYAVIGVVVAILSFAIVNFVITKFGG